jgi:hypothetical protein
MAFETWRSLTEHDITDDQARDMMLGFVVGIAGPLDEPSVPGDPTIRR